MNGIFVACNNGDNGFYIESEYFFERLRTLLTKIQILDENSFLFFKNIIG